MDSADERLARLIAEAHRGPGPAAARLGRALAGRAWNGGTDRTEPVAREWLRRWGPTRVPRQSLLRDCSCTAGPCSVCN